MSRISTDGMLKQPSASPSLSAGTESAQMATVPTEIKSLARSHTGAAVRVLAGIMRQPKAAPAARVAAATALLDRGWGKPAQAMEHSGPNAGPIQVEDVNDGERVKALIAFLAKTGGAA